MTRSIVRTLLFALYVCWHATTALGQSGMKASSPDVIWIKAFVANPNSADFDFALEAGERLASQLSTGDAKAQSEARALQTEVRNILEQGFVKTWIRGDRAGFTLGQFSDLARTSKSEPFGKNMEQIVGYLTNTSVPARWQNREFLDWLTRNLPTKVNGESTLKILLKPGLPDDPSGLLDRSTFLLEIASDTDVKQVRDPLHSVVKNEVARNMPAYLKHLAKLDSTSAFKRWKAGSESSAIQRLLGDRLFALPVDTWSQAGSSLTQLVKASSHDATSFLDKATKHLLAEEASQTGSNAEVLGTLSSLCPAAAAYRILSPAQSINWFTWLHEKSLLQPLHGRDAALLKPSYALVKDFDTKKHFPRLFPWVRDYYYKQSAYQQPVFDDLLRPRARLGHADLVLGAVLNGQFDPDHRAILAMDMLQAGDGNGLSPAWTKAGRSRINAAIAIYGNLVPSRSRADVLTAHLNRPLLQTIVDEVLKLLRNDDTVERTIDELRPLAEQLKTYRDQGAEPRKCAPLTKLHAEIVRDVDQALAALPEAPPDRGALAEQVKKPIQRFVRTLALSFRLRAVLDESLSDSGAWVDRARNGLRQRVFGLDTSEMQAAGAEQPVLYWSPAVTRFRAEMLCQLDAPLRDCLVLDKNGRDRRAFWNDIYLPVIPVHGFLKELSAQTGKGRWPHVAWVLAETDRHRPEKIEDFFRALRTKRWLDAEAVVLELAELHRQQALRDNIWCIDPTHVFMGHWSVNANFLVWKRMLDAEAPPAHGRWQLLAIGRKLVDELKRGVMPVGPTHPRADSVPDADTHRGLWEFAGWAANVVTAVEWQVHSVTGGQWKVHITSSPARRFEFELSGTPTARLVDGELRAALCSLMLDRLPENAELAKGGHVDRQFEAATTVMLLPNDADNLVGNPSLLDNYLTLRQKVYRDLDATLRAAADRAVQIRLLKHMMWLEVSRRSSGSFEPTFESALTYVQEKWPKDATMEVAIKDIRIEQAELLEVLKQHPADDLTATRAYLDSMLQAVVPGDASESPDARAFRSRNYQARLGTLNDQNVLIVLRIRSKMRKLAAHAAAAEKDPHSAKDLERISRMLALVDHHVFYQRTDFNEEQIKHYLRVLPGKDLNDQPAKWRPALVVLAWLSMDLQKNLLKSADRLDKSSDKSLQGRLLDVRFALFDLNETLFTTVRAIAGRPDAAQVFADFRPVQLEWRALNFKLLAESIIREIASAESLSADCFQGALNNVEIVTVGQAANDKILHDRLFGSLNECWPKEYAEMRPVRPGTTMNIDGVVRFADGLIDAPSMPPSLKAGADTFLRTVGRDLLANGETVKGVLKATTEIVKRTRANASLRYRSFYDSQLTVSVGDTVQFSPAIERALAAPFFAGKINPQRADIQLLLKEWRTQLATRTERDPLFVKAVQTDSGRVIMKLMKGIGRPDGSPHIWAPADALEAEEGVRLMPPKEFFELVQWWLAQARPDDPSEVRALFQPRR